MVFLDSFKVTVLFCSRPGLDGLFGGTVTFACLLTIRPMSAEYPRRGDSQIENHKRLTAPQSMLITNENKQDGCRTLRQSGIARCVFVWRSIFLYLPSHGVTLAVITVNRSVKIGRFKAEFYPLRHLVTHRDSVKDRTDSGTFVTVGL